MSKIVSLWVTIFIFTEGCTPITWLVFAGSWSKSQGLLFPPHLGAFSKPLSSLQLCGHTLSSTPSVLSQAYSHLLLSLSREFEIWTSGVFKRTADLQVSTHKTQDSRGCVPRVQVSMRASENYFHPQELVTSVKPCSFSVTLPQSEPLDHSTCPTGSWTMEGQG